jgi:hypothetical protein
MILENYIKETLKKIIVESFNLKDKKVVDDITTKLNDKCKEVMGDLKSKGSGEAYSFYIYEYLENELYKNKPKCQELGEGVYRVGYEIPGTNLVIKLAKDDEGAKANRQELALSKREHGPGASDFFIKVYNYDTFSDLPYWIVCERVEPLSDINDLERLIKIFPTFWSILKETDHYSSDAKLFKEVIVDTVREMISKSRSKKIKNYKNKVRRLARISKNINKDDLEIEKKFFFGDVSKRAFYDLASVPSNIRNTVPFEDVVWGEDFKRLSVGFNHISTYDVHQENWGIRFSDNPKPSDIVILDFQIY